MPQLLMLHCLSGVHASQTVLRSRFDFLLLLSSGDLKKTVRDADIVDGWPGNATGVFQQHQDEEDDGESRDHEKSPGGQATRMPTVAEKVVVKPLRKRSLLAPRGRGERSLAHPPQPTTAWRD